MACQLAGHAILIVENEALHMLDIVHVLECAGARVVTTNSVELALQLIEAEGWSAVVASALSVANYSRLCDGLERRNVPLLMFTGWSLARGACRDHLWVHKLACAQMLIQAMNELVQER
jgi:CheY-like chemotaxis protein